MLNRAFNRTAAGCAGRDPVSREEGLIYVWAIVSIVAGIVCVPLGIIGILAPFILASVKPELKCVIDHDVLLDARDEGIFEALDVPEDASGKSVSRTRVAFWNRRGGELAHENIVDNNPFRLEFDPATQIVLARCIRQSAPHVRASVANVVWGACPSVCVDFSLLKEGDGGVIEIITRGEGKPKVAGVMRNAAVKSKFSGALGPDDLDRLAGKSMVYRLLFGASITNAALTLTGLVAFVATVVVTLIIDTPLVGDSSKLVPYRHYNLNLATGQVRFAHAVIRTNYYDRTSWLVIGSISLGVAVLGFIALLMAVFRYVKNRIPTAVAGGAYVMELNQSSARAS